MSYLGYYCMIHFDVLKDIPHYSSWVKIKPVKKGWSLDTKFYIENDAGKKMLLRISDISELKSKQMEYENIKSIAELGINMCFPIDFGICGRGSYVYSLFTWVVGEDAEVVLPRKKIEEQYEYGIKAGRILRKIHSIPAPPDQLNWETRFLKKIQHKIKNYEECKIKIEHDAEFIKFIRDNVRYLADRPQVLHHGDFHSGNLIISPDDTLWVIDFNRMDYGDPWEEFNRCNFSWKASVPFTIGQIHGYFDNNIPDLFFRLMALYVATNAIGSIAWAIPYGEKEVENMLAYAKIAYNWYDGFKTYIPVWYQFPN